MADFNNDITRKSYICSVCDCDTENTDGLCDEHGQGKKEYLASAWVNIIGHFIVKANNLKQAKRKATQMLWNDTIATISENIKEMDARVEEVEELQPALERHLEKVDVPQ